MLRCWGDHALSHDHKQVLLLNSYHKGFMWTDEITRGIEDALLDHDVDLHIEYMDAKRQFSPSYFELLKNILSVKHQNRNYDLVITSDNIAFDFIKRWKHEVFGDVPVVFCGLNYPQQTDFDEVDDVTGVGETADLSGNLSLIRKLHSEVEHILIITDDTITGELIQHEAMSIMPLFSDIELELVFDVRMEELLYKLDHLEENSVVLFTLFFRDKSGRFFTYDLATEYVCNHAKVPVYGVWRFSLGHGIVGGLLTNGYDQGRMSAEKALSILSGVDSSEIPIMWKSPTKYGFDYELLKHFGIKIEDVPIRSEIINEPNSFYSQYKELIWKVIFLFIAMLLAIMGLAYGLARAKRMEIALRKSENKFRSLYEQAPIALLKANSRTREMLSANPAAVELVGYDSEDELVRNMKVSDLYVDPDQRIKILDELKEKGFVRNAEFEVKKKDGERFWVQYSSRRSSSDIVEFFLVDVSERKRVELALAENQARMNQVQQFAKIGSWHHHITEGFTYCSNEIYEMFGLDTGSPIPDFNTFLYSVHEEDRSFFKRKTLEAYATATPLQMTYRYDHPDGTIHYMRNWANVHKSKYGQPEKMVGITHDITPQVQNEKHLERLNVILQSIRGINQLIVVENSKEGLIQKASASLVEGNGFVYASIALIDEEKRIIHYAETSSIDGLSLFEEGIYPLHVLKSLDESKDTIEIYKYPHSSRLEDSQKKWAGLSPIICPLIFKSGLYGYFSAVSKQDIIEADEHNLIREVCDDIAFALSKIDLEEQKTQAVRELIRAKEKAEIASRAKDEFLSVMSHELRTPLNPILGFAQLMQDDHKDEPEKTYLSSIILSANKQLELINDILEYIDLDKGTVIPKLTQFDLLEVCESIFDSVVKRSSELDYRIGVSEQFDPVVPGTIVETDRGILSQLLERILSNACKYTEEGSVTLEIGQKKNGSEDMFHFSIKDTGIGISVLKQEVLFDPFSQADSSHTRNYEGIGIGLAICKKAVTLLGGSIGVNSEHRKGADFWFKLPMKVVNQDKKPENS